MQIRIQIITSKPIRIQFFTLKWIRILLLLLMKLMESATTDL